MRGPGGWVRPHGPRVPEQLARAGALHYFCHSQGEPTQRGAPLGMWGACPRYHSWGRPHLPAPLLTLGGLPRQVRIPVPSGQSLGLRGGLDSVFSPPGTAVRRVGERGSCVSHPDGRSGAEAPQPPPGPAGGPPSLRPISSSEKELPPREGFAKMRWVYTTVRSTIHS